MYMSASNRQNVHVCDKRLSTCVRSCMHSLGNGIHACLPTYMIAHRFVYFQGNLTRLIYQVQHTTAVNTGMAVSSAITCLVTRGQYHSK